MSKQFNYYNLVLFLCIVLSSCNKDILIPYGVTNKINVNTSEIIAITQTTAISGVEVSGGFGEDVLDKGVCWSVSGNPTVNNAKSSGGNGLGVVGLSLTGLNPGTFYYVRSYVITKIETLYGAQKQFSTQKYQLAAVSTSNVNNIALTTAVAGGNVTTLGGGNVTAKGICWSTSTTPTILNAKTVDGSGLGPYSSSLVNLSAGTVYYVRAYATNQAGTAYGTQVSFSTVSNALPILSTISVNSISKTSAFATGNVSSQGGSAVTSKGICWSTSNNPTLSFGQYFNNGSGAGSITGTLTGLASSTTYYFRAYASNSAGTAYGAVLSFRTL